MADDSQLAKDGVIAFVMFLLTGLSGWLFKSTLANKEKLALQELQIKGLERDVVELKKNALTKEHIREVMEEALDRRDEKAHERREEYTNLRRHETREVVKEELERFLDRPGANPRHRPSRGPSGEGHPQ